MCSFKVQEGSTLNDEDRIPWLKKKAEEVSLRLDNSSTLETREKLVVVACSALKTMYRNLLVDDIATKNLVTFVFLDIPSKHLHERMTKRAESENHFMPSSLIESQLKDLEKPFDEEGCKMRNVITINGELALKQIHQIGTVVVETL